MRDQAIEEVAFIRTLLQGRLAEDMHQNAPISEFPFCFCFGRGGPIYGNEHAVLYMPARKIITDPHPENQL